MAGRSSFRRARTTSHEGSLPGRCLREIRACDGAPGSEGESSRAEGIRRAGRETRGPNGCGKPMLVRLRNEDRLFLDARAEARGMRPATYAFVLLRSHLLNLTPLPKHEYLALKRSIAELASIGRNINQIAKAANGAAGCRTLRARNFGRCSRYASPCGTTPRRFSRPMRPVGRRGMPKRTFRIREGEPLLNVVSYGSGGPRETGGRLTPAEAYHLFI
jgi:hypothetical protein